MKPKDILSSTKITSKKIDNKSPTASKKNKDIKNPPKIVIAGSYKQNDWRSGIISNYAAFSNTQENKLSMFHSCFFLGFYPRQDLQDFYKTIKSCHLLFIYFEDFEDFQDQQKIDACAICYQHNKKLILIYHNIALFENPESYRYNVFTKNIFCLDQCEDAFYGGKTAREVIYSYLYWNGYFCQSPLEKAFWNKLKDVGSGWELQLPIKVGGHEYFVDFAMQKFKIAIEIDGYAYHSRNREDFVKERERWRLIQSEGWRIIPFAGSEVKYSLKACIDFVRNELDKAQKTKSF